MGALGGCKSEGVLGGGEGRARARAGRRAGGARRGGWLTAT